jgi:hypothetical protein
MVEYCSESAFPPSYQVDIESYQSTATSPLVFVISSPQSVCGRATTSRRRPHETDESVVPSAKSHCARHFQIGITTHLNSSRNLACSFGWSSDTKESTDLAIKLATFAFY